MRLADALTSTIADAWGRRRRRRAAAPSGEQMFRLSREFPSVINNGYRHIEVACALLERHGCDAGHTIADVGAAAGIVAGMFARAFPRNTILAFEPVPASYRQLVEATAACGNVVPHQVALGVAPGDRELHLSARITSSSLFETNRAIGDSYFASNLETVSTTSVKVATLDEMIDPAARIALIKMDVQGSELDVLRGAEQTLGRTRFVLTEVMNHDFYAGAPHYHEIDAFLRDRGFGLHDIIPSIRRDERLMEWDVIYCNAGLAGG